MLIRDWMTKDPVTATPEMSMMRASRLLKEKSFRRLPVVDEDGKLVGIVTDRDIKEASPSKATSLDIHELHYLLAELQVKDIMTKDPITASPYDTVERVAVMMLDKHIGGLPVVDSDGKLVGIITETDVFKVLIDITGARSGGLQMAFQLPLTSGSLKAVLDDLKAVDARIISILTSLSKDKQDSRDVLIRILPLGRQVEDELVVNMKARHTMLYWARDSVHPFCE